MTLPRRFGGLEIDPLDAVDVVEQLSYADGAAGWCGFIGNSTSFFGWLEPDVTLDILTGTPHVAAASIFAPSGQGRVRRQGWVHRGRTMGLRQRIGTQRVEPGRRAGDGRRSTGPARRRRPGLALRLPTDQRPDDRGQLGHPRSARYRQQRRRRPGATVTAEQLAMPMFDEPKADDAIFRLGFWGLISHTHGAPPPGRGASRPRRARTSPTDQGATARAGPRWRMIRRSTTRSVGLGLSSRPARAYLDDATGRAWSTVADWRHRDRGRPPHARIGPAERHGHRARCRRRLVSLRRAARFCSATTSSSGAFATSTPPACTSPSGSTAIAAPVATRSAENKPRILRSFSGGPLRMLAGDPGATKGRSCSSSPISVASCDGEWVAPS